MCCDSWGRKKSDTTEQLNRTELNLSLICVCVCAQLCPTLCDPVDYSLPGSSLHRILQARILEWVAMPSSRGSS